MSQMQPYDSQGVPSQNYGQPMPFESGGRAPTPVAPLTDRRDPAGVVLAIAWVITVVTIGYMLPWAIAATRGKSNQAAIGILNFLLGWTFIGWLVALVMACLPHQVVGPGTHSTMIVTQSFSLDPAPQAGQDALAPPQVLPPAGWYAHPLGGQRYWDGRAWTEHTAP